MQLLSLVPNVMVEDVNQTIEFYKDVLGFEVVATVPETGTLNWAWVKSGEANLMFQSRQSLAEDIIDFKDTPAGATLNFYVKTDDIKAWHEKLKGKVKLVQDLRTTFYDCNGYIITLAQNN